ncbi:cell division transport system permease protein [Jannaschia faecimaris]|uniref:Cell division transport system permease protein n=1 Tax=Jannaschia faecimaris TaxID=1244108 RepID=A0A1H3LV20_9RHOB|nr:cell division protein FtsX [Jannaschia faecimaris]SDY68262.1 cell division transport system permease protein [Jannaschia faecimaris]
MKALRALLNAALGDRQADRVVPPTGHTVWLTVLTAGAMAFLAVFALALSLATGRLADRWADSLAQAATIRISAPPEQADAQVAALETILSATPGIAEARVLEQAEQLALLEPWLGPDLPLDTLPLPRLIEVTGTEDLDVEGLRQRLAAEVPGATYDDHTRWRQPLVQAADRLRSLGWIALALIAGTLAAMITLAARAALAANRQIIHVLRLVGARDAYVIRAFTRRFTLRTAMGAAVGATSGGLAIAFLPQADPAGGFLTGLGFNGAGWLLLPLIPLFAGAVAFLATRRAAFRALAGFE